MKLLNTETPVTRNFIPQSLLNVQDFYFHKVGYTSYDEGVFRPQTEHTKLLFSLPPLAQPAEDQLKWIHQNDSSSEVCFFVLRYNAGLEYSACVHRRVT
jgi:hypothetical protein